MAKTKTVHVPERIKARVNAKINECIKIAEQKFDRQFEFPTIKYDVRGTTAGYAQDYSYTVHFNSILLVENEDLFINTTVPHEFAHLVDGIVYPNTRNTFGGQIKRSIHGPTWQRIMRLFGSPVSRCHSYNTSNAKVRQKARHVYTCNVCSKKMVLGPVRHRRQQRKQTYSMRGCRTHALRFGYAYMGLEGSQMAELKKVKPKAKAPTPARSGTKKAAAIVIYRANSHLSKDEIIAKIAAGCNMSQQGATTYYYAAKKAA